MTPIGHFMCASAVAGTIDLTTVRETLWCFAWYALFLAAFAALALVLPPGLWAMHLHDAFGNAALLFFLVFWFRKDRRRQLFVCLLIGGQVLAAYTHLFDAVVLRLTDAVPAGMWRPHNILHTPLAAVAIPLLVAPLVHLAMRTVRTGEVFFYLFVGYALHIAMDTLTYAFPIYPLWPASAWSISLAGFFQQPDAVSRWLGNPLFVFSEPDVRNVDGFIVYKTEVAVNALLAALFFVGRLSRRFVGARS